MLDDNEREALRDIQRRLFVDDPDLERSFRALDGPPPPGVHRWVRPTCAAVAALFAVVGVLAGSPGGALAFAFVAVAVWWAGSVRDHPEAHRPDD